MAPAAEPREKNCEQEEAGELHVKHGSKSANAVGGETREKIGTAPGKCRQKAQQNSHVELGGLARFRGLAFLSFETENRHDFLQIFPDFAFCAGIAQQVGGVVRGHQFSAAKFEPLSAELGNAAVCFENGLRGGAAQADDYFGGDGVNLAQQEWRALADFIFFWSAIFRRAAFHDVADVDIISLQAHGFDHLRQKFSGTANERESLHVFVVTRTFAYEHKFGFGIAIAENYFVARLMKLAARAFAEIGSNLQEGIVGNFVKSFK
jgi:hypothetical protein